jgi:Condensation domain
MYFSSMLRPGNSADAWGTVLEVSGDLAVEQLRRALEVLRDRHESLRSTFVERGGDVFQVVHDDAEPVRIDVVAAGGDSPDERRERAEAQARHLLDRPFDIASGPLWRAGVVRVEPCLHPALLDDCPGIDPAELTGEQAGRWLPPPTSLAQQRIWFIEQLVPGTALHHLRAQFAVCGELDPVALERAVNAVIDRHDVLRTRFRVVDGVPAQEVLPEARVAVRQLDVSGDAVLAGVEESTSGRWSTGRSATTPGRALCCGC